MPTPTTSSSASSVPDPGDVDIDSLLSLMKWGGAVGTRATLTYSFPWSTSGTASFAGYNGQPYSTLNEPSSGSALDPFVQIPAVKAALATWANVANLDFAQGADTSTSVGDIRLALTNTSSLASDGTAAWGWAQYSDSSWPSAGDIWISTQSPGTTSTDPAQRAAGCYNFVAPVHEIGHTLGLKHPFEDAPQLPAALDTKQYTVMSYADAPDSLFVQVTQTAGGWEWHSYNVQPDGPMVGDIAAMQYLYGANMSYQTGDNSYTFDPTKPSITRSGTLAATTRSPSRTSRSAAPSTCARAITRTSPSCPRRARASTGPPLRRRGSAPTTARATSASRTARSSRTRPAAPATTS